MVKKTMLKICLVGDGAYAAKHAQSFKSIKEVTLTGVIGSNPATAEQFATEHKIPVWSTNLEEGLETAQADAVIVATPTPTHAKLAEAVLLSGRHVLVEIPLVDQLEDLSRLVKLQEQTGLILMAGHIRRFNSGHHWIHEQLASGNLQLQHLVVETCFYRRTNKNALGQTRDWTDHLLWHHACHSVDLFQYQTSESVHRFTANQGPQHPELGIAMDMNISMSVPSGAMCSINLSFNNDGPLGTWFRYICDKGTFLARYDELTDGWGKELELEGANLEEDGLVVQNQEFVTAIMEKREPVSSINDVKTAYELLHKIELLLNQTSSDKKG